MVWVVTIVLAAVGLVLLVRWFSSSEPRQVVSALRWTAVGVGTALLLIVLWGGARPLLAAALPLMLPLLFRLPALLRRLRSLSGMGGVRSSAVETRFLRMRLDHDSGSVEGTVKEGPLRGRRLDELSAAELSALLRECRAEDSDSAAVLEAWIERHRPGGDSGSDSGEGASEEGRSGRAGSTDGPPGGGPGGGPGGMTRAEALAVLGLPADADEAAIRAAHHRLIQQVHPDRGGSDWMAAKLNEARRVLLGK